MEANIIVEVLLNIILAVALPVLVLWTALKILPSKQLKKSKKLILYLIAVLTYVWVLVLTQLFIPLAFIGLFLMMFAASWLIPDFTIQKKIIFALLFSGLYILTAVIANVLIPVFN